MAWVASRIDEVEAHLGLMFWFDGFHWFQPHSRVFGAEGIHGFRVRP
jgi:hypothetical protein